MKALVVMAALVGAAGIASAKPLEPASPIGQPVHDVRGRHHPLAPIPYLWRAIDMQRQNVGANGRKNAIRDEQQVGETPMLQPQPLSGGIGW